MFGRYFEYMAMREKAKNLPEVEVTEEEFIQAMIAEGKTEEEAKLQATVGRGLGGSCMVGDRMLRIKG